MHSKMVANRQRLSLSLESSAATHAEDINQRAREVLSAAVAEDETVPDLELVQKLVGRLIARARAKMEAVDRRHLEETVKDRGARRQRDDSASTIRRRILRIRDSFDGAYGPGRCEEILGFGTRIPQDPMLLRQLAENAIEFATAEGFELPPTELEGVELSVEAFVHQLQEPLSSLKEAQEQLSGEDRKSNATIKEKNAAIDEFDDVYRRASKFLEGSYTLVGEDLLASRVRPTDRRSSPAPEEDEDIPPDEPENDDPEVDPDPEDDAEP